MDTNSMSIDELKQALADAEAKASSTVKESSASDAVNATASTASEVQSSVPAVAADVPSTAPASEVKATQPEIKSEESKASEEQPSTAPLVGVTPSPAVEEAKPSESAVETKPADTSTPLEVKPEETKAVDASTTPSQAEPAQESKSEEPVSVIKSMPDITPVVESVVTTVKPDEKAEQVTQSVIQPTNDSTPAVAVDSVVKDSQAPTALPDTSVKPVQAIPPSTAPVESTDALVELQAQVHALQQYAANSSDYATLEDLESLLKKLNAVHDTLVSALSVLSIAFIDPIQRATSLESIQNQLLNCKE